MAIAERPPAASGPPPQPSAVYDPTKDRENVRGHLAYIVVGLFALLVVLTLWFAHAVVTDDPALQRLLQVVGILLSPVVALVGAVTGFYYGEKAGSR